MSLEQTGDLAAPAERLDGHRRLAPLVSAVARERAAERQAYMFEGCHSSARTHVFLRLPFQGPELVLFWDICCAVKGRCSPRSYWLDGVVRPRGIDLQLFGFELFLAQPIGVAPKSFRYLSDDVVGICGSRQIFWLPRCCA